MSEDVDLVKQILAGDTSAFEDLVRRYEAGILRFTYNMVRNKETAEDITQEAFISAYNKLYTFKRDNKFSTWLYQIARNKCIDYIRRSSKRKIINVEFSNISSKEVSPESFVEYMETKHIIECFITTLGDVDRQILILRYCQEHLTFGDIAEVLKMGEAAVKKRYYKIYEKYEAFIEKNGCDKRLKKVIENA